MSVEVHSTTQRIIVKPRVLDGTPGAVRTQTIDARPNAHVSIVRGGPVGPPGVQGIPGESIVGPEGPQGPVGPDSSYRHVQGATSDTWVIVHNLGYYPAITVVDSGGTLILGDVTHDSVNQTTVRFSSAFSGVAYAS